MIKKFFKIFILIILFMPLKVYSISYIPSLYGNNTFYSKSDNNYNTKTNLVINISNLENIGYVDVYVNYDKNLLGIFGCNKFNYITTGCSIDDNKDIYYQYKYSDGYKEYFNKYDFYSVTFMPTDKTPSTGSTTVTVSFKNAKDINQNPININSISRTYNFDKPGIKISTKVANDPSYNEKEDSKNNININTTKITENNSYSKENNSANESTKDNTINNISLVKNITVKGYKLDFNSKKSKYKIFIKNSVNKLDIKIEEEQNVHYEIIGADDLKMNNYKVLVKASNDKFNEEYIIYAIIKEENKESFFLKKINKKNMITGIIIIIVIIISIFLIIVRKNRKLNKLLDNF